MFHSLWSSLYFADRANSMSMFSELEIENEMFFEYKQIVFLKVSQSIEGTLSKNHVFCVAEYFIFFLGYFSLFISIKSFFVI